MNLRIPTVTAALITITIAACGGDSSSLDLSNKDKTLGELSIDEQVQLCEELREAGIPESTRRGSITFGCLLAEAFQGGECDDTRVEQCIQAGLDAPENDDDTTCEQKVAADPLSSSCTATVAEMEQCTKDSFEAWAQFDGLTCSDESPSGDTLSLEPESCKTLNEKCPELDDEEEEEEN